MDEDGFVYIVDRTKDMLLCGGFNVYPRNIEEAIYQHPSVEEVSVIGIPDDYRGETPKAFVKLKAGAPALTLEEMKAFLKDRLGKHEMIGAMEIRDELAQDSGRQDIEEGPSRIRSARACGGVIAERSTTKRFRLRNTPILDRHRRWIYISRSVYPGEDRCRLQNGATVSPSAFLRPWWRRCGLRKATKLRFTLPARASSALRGSQAERIY